MSDIKKLREELAKAEAIEAENKKKQELEYYSKYSGIYRCVYFSRGKKRKMQGISFIRLSKFSRDSHGRICYVSEIITASDYKSYHTEVSAKYTINNETIYDNTCPGFMTWDKSDTTDEKFNQLIKLVKLKSNSFFEILQKVGEIEADGSEPNTPDSFDLPYIQFEAYESTLFKDSDFMLPGYRYLISKNSIKLALEDLDEESKDLRRNSFYFDSCDREYVRNKENSIESARAKVMSAVY